MEEQFAHTNLLINETSPYLLQHAHNPVNWYPWGDAAFEKAKKEDKLVLISIGYSSCHWCHVMEHESFEDSAVAALMNERFVCVKVDREERPDVDQIYMNAVQIMTGSGGWPLNCFALADGRPVYGGTYYPKDNWVELLNNLSTTYTKDKSRFEEYATNLTEGIQQSELIKKPVEDSPIEKAVLHEMVEKWSETFDKKEGGPNRSPKFPIPNNYNFLMSYGQLTKDEVLLDYVDLTLQKMALGGIYDQVGGGFARYATDAIWKVPHFEKMLYDNAQLISLYSVAYQRTKNPLYKHVVYQTIAWLEREMTAENGGFMSALDADSEGEEGKFYTWSKEALKAVLNETEYELVKTYYHINPKGAWEGKYILLREMGDAHTIKKTGLSEVALAEKMEAINKKLLKERANRIRPGIDDKILTSWNGLMISGLADAAMAFNEPKFESLAIEHANWLLKNLVAADGSLMHTHKNKTSKIAGFLDDYAFTSSAFIKLYELTFEEKWLDKANQFVAYTIEHFKDPKSGMFYFTSNVSESLIARKMEVNDNVIPASNSEIANVLFDLGTLLDSTNYKNTAIQMLSNVQGDMLSYPSGYSNWGRLHLKISFPYYEIAVTGKGWKEKLNQFNHTYLPNKLMMGGVKGDLPLLEGKFIGETTIFVCVNKSCQMPVTMVEDALKQMTTK
ncbi:thioredoxin domain-containing protein [Putridiphycobacter roseus]|uniref:Thioredoxin domain-containing protein n=2 Tax=Putridiphycobacter roseus TaxID=2219161 RepID=A0A2W1MYP8_9FLAO|nr:thioredoxin domain-containing protein [Putridiphycobacter roseus]